MKFVALVSGGKDSIYSILECQRNGHELVACVHLGAPLKADNNDEEEEEESYMYQTAASEVLPTLVEECLGVPLILHRRTGKSVNTTLVYEDGKNVISSDSNDNDMNIIKKEATTTAAEDEVEDLYQALATAIDRFPLVTAVSSGAILSTYQRVRIENVCNRLNLVSLSYLWRMASQKTLLERMINDGIDAILVKTACPPGLKPFKHLNKSLSTLHHSGLFQRLNDMYEFHMCGEGGEFETLVLDCPTLYKKKLILDDVKIIETDDGVGILVIHKCHAEDKAKDDEIENGSNEDTNETSEIRASINSKVLPSPADISKELISPQHRSHLPHVRGICGGLLHVSEIMSPSAALSSSFSSSSKKVLNEAELAVEEALCIFQILQTLLSRYGCTAKDIVFVHLYLSEISHFSSINKPYRDFFGTSLPPSRSCVAVGKHVLPGGRRVLMDCMVLCGSGQYMRISSSSGGDNRNSIVGGQSDAYANAAGHTKTSKLRSVLHVQSISNWAPVCVGPYSQANIIRSSLIFLAGQIGLIPCTMKLQASWERQLEQCWTNIANVLDALDSGALEQMLSGLVYVSTAVYNNSKNENVFRIIESISQQQISTNGGVLPGVVDSTKSSTEEFGGYEDEGTWREMMQQQNDNMKLKDKYGHPLLVVCIPEMPVGALVEVEVVCASAKAASCLPMNTVETFFENRTEKQDIFEGRVQWDTGHDFPSYQPPTQIDCEDVHINTATRSIGNGNAAMSIVAASLSIRHTVESFQNQEFLDIEEILDKMINAFIHCSLQGNSGLTLDMIIHIRLYYISCLNNSNSSIHIIMDDGSRIRSALHSVISSRYGRQQKRSRHHIPALTIVPVAAMSMINCKSNQNLSGDNDTSSFLAMQILAADPVHMETEMWIHHGREKL